MLSVVGSTGIGASVRSGLPFTVEDARKPLEPTVTVGRENVKPMCCASLPPQGDHMDRIRTRFLRKRDDSCYIHMLEFRRGWSTPMLLPGWP